MSAPDRQARVLRAAGATDVGRRRRVNEDRFHVDPARGVFIVVDGLGGQAAGDRAADTAVAAMVERLSRETGPVTDRLREAITIANNEIYRQASTRADWHGMACVLTAVVLDGSRAVVGHVGDSRLYRIQDAAIEKITPDHSPVGEREDARELSESEAMSHPRRNEVYRDVGSEPHAVADDDFAFVTEIELPPQAALLLCSDGLTDLVPAETIRSIARSGAGSPDRVVHDLIDAANAAGGKDNVTAVFIEGEQFASSVRPPVAAGGRGGRGPGRRLVMLAVLIATLAGAFIGRALPAHLWGTTGAILPDAGAPRTLVVNQGESISAALEQAMPGTAVVVEPGEYRERLRLKDHVRVISRVPRSAVLRLPADASAGDAAVIAEQAIGVELSGFQIVGDAATPLGIGVLVRDASARLIDLDVRGAAVAAMDLGAGEVVVLGSELHDNPGAALIVRAGGTPRIAQSSFARNGLSPSTPAAIAVENDAHPRWSRNVFPDLRTENIPLSSPDERAALATDNWFIQTRPAARGAAPARGRSAR